VKEPMRMVSGSYCLESSSSFSQKNLNPPSPPLLTHLKAMSTLSPSQECRQSMGFTSEIKGGSLRALNGITNEFSSVMKVTRSSKSAKEGAEKDIEIKRDIPGAMSPWTFEGYFTDLIVKLSVVGGMNLILREILEALVTLRGIS